MDTNSARWVTPFVRQGSLEVGGMAGFADIPSAEDVETIHEYLIQA